MPPVLHVIAGPDEGENFKIEKETVNLGRGYDNDFVINDSGVSRNHAKIICREMQYYIEDLGSSHGIFVNGVRNNKELLLHNNDRIRLGNTQLVFQLGPKELKQEFDLEEAGQSSAIETRLSDGSMAFSLPTESGSDIQHQSKHHLEILSRVAAATRSLFDRDELLKQLMNLVFDIFDPERGAFLLLDEKTKDLVPQLVVPENAELNFSQTIIEHSIRERVSLLISDTAQDERFQDSDSVLAESILSAICCPMIQHNKVLGVIYIDTKSHLINYRNEDLTLLNIIAANAAISIENATLVTEKVNSERLAAIGVAVSGISHYIKNIVSGISGSSGLIQQGIKENDMELVRESWPILMRSNDKIRSLVQDMLSYSKERKPVLAEGNVNMLINEIYESVNETAREAGVEFVLELDKDLPNCCFDFNAVYDSILNLVTNAIDASQEVTRPLVKIQTEIEMSKTPICIKVSDNGPGIPEQIEERIFEPFFSTKGSQGTGLGLAVARKTVEEHGGSLSVFSGIGQDTIFKYCLPLNT